MFATPIRSSSPSHGFFSSAFPKKAVKQESQNNHGEEDILPIALVAEGENGKRDPCDGSGDQNEKSELDQSSSFKCDGFAQNSGNRAEALRLTLENVIVGCRKGMSRKINHSSRKYDGRRKEHPATQEQSHEFLYTLVGMCQFAAHSCSLRCQSLPVSPLLIISIARAPMTTAKTIRRTRTCAPASTRAPAKDPARTPSITGIASSGSM